MINSYYIVKKFHKNSYYKAPITEKLLQLGQSSTTRATREELAIQGTIHTTTFNHTETLICKHQNQRPRSKRSQ